MKERDIIRRDGNRGGTAGNPAGIRLPGGQARKITMLSAKGNTTPELTWESLAAVTQNRFTEERLRQHEERRKTGFAGLDRALGGGIGPGLIVLGGSPGLGKSTFSIQMAQALSEKFPVLYFSLEMTAERIAAKFLARYLFQNQNALGLEEPFPADKLISGMPEDAPWDPNVLQAIEQARVHCGEALKNIFVITEPLPPSGIAGALLAFMREHEDLSAPPLVMVDYLQILPQEDSRNRNEKQAVEESLKHMVRLAHGDLSPRDGVVFHGLPVILISSLSRGSYKTPMEISSFKETGGIEYSADILLGLQFRACHEKNMDLNAEKGKVPREVELSILKQRYGSSGDLVRLRYYAAYDCFLEEPDSKEADGAEQMDSFSIDAGLLGSMDIDSFAAASADAQMVAFVGGIEEPGEFVPIPADAEVQAGEAQKETKKFIPTSVMCNTKVANELRQGKSGDGNQCEVFPGVYTEYDLSAPLSFADCDVADAIYTLLSKEKRTSFSVRHVLRSLSGDGRQTLTEQKKRAITESIERLRDTILIIQCEKEMQQRETRKKQGLSGIKTFQGQFLNVRLENGTYVFEKNGGPPMPLYAYGEKTNQMISFPESLLHVVHEGGRKLSDTEDTVCIKRYVIRRLEIMRNKRSRGDKGFQSISFREDRELASLLKLYDHYPSKDSRVQKRRRLRTTVLQVLAYYKRIGYIQDYRVSRQSVSIIGKIQNPWKLPDVVPGAAEPEK